MQESGSSGHDAQPPLDTQEVRGQLARILTSPDFNVPERLRGFLTFVVEEFLAGRGDRIKAYGIAINVFGRKADFDAQNDPLVRIEAGRLRRALERYYLTSGLDDPIVIDIPKGRYTPKIHGRCATLPLSAGQAEPLHKQPAFAQKRSILRLPAARRPTAIMGLVLLGLLWAAIQAWPLIAHHADETAGTGNPVVALVVSPFANLSGPEGTLYAAGISDELLSQLARFRELRVIGRDPSKPAPAEGQQPIAADRMRYRLEGSVRMTGTHLRVSSRLLDGRTDEIVWSRIYKRDLQGTGSFEIEADIAAKVATAVAEPYGAIFAPVSLGESTQIPGNSEAYSCILRFYQYRKEPTREEHRLTRDCLAKTLAQNPGYSTGWAMLAYLYLDEDRLGFNRQPQGSPGGTRAREAAKRAVRLDPSNVRALQALMIALFYSKEPEAALEIGEKALALNPNDTEFLAEFGSRLAQAGDRKRGLAMIEESVDRNPNQSQYFIAILAQGYYLIGDNDRALYWIRRADMKSFANYHLVAALIFARAQLKQEAQASVDAFLKMRPRFFDNFDAELAMRNFNARDRLTLIEGARQAGLPVGAIER